jgi:putative ABC transport system permease protein
MTTCSRVPLAWLNLTRDRRRFAVSLAGVGFAVVLMFVETGFYYALFDSTVALIHEFNAELVLLSKIKDTLASNEPFPLRRLEQARGYEGVAAVYPIYMERTNSLWRNTDPEDRRSRPIRVLAFNLEDPAWLLPEIEQHREALKLPDTALIDVKSKEFYGAREEGVVTELAQRRLEVVGTFALGTDFTNDGTLIMSARNFVRYFPSRIPGQSPLSKVEVGLIKLQPGVDPRAVQAALRQELAEDPAAPPESQWGRDVVVLTKDELVRKEMQLWQNSSPIGFIFGLGTAIGFVVGVVICYQVLSTDIADHLAEFATLKAIGYHNRYLTGVVLQQAVFLSLLGFVPGFVVSGVLYGLLANWTGLPMAITWDRTATILGLTIVMCTLSGIIAVRKVQTADPAEVF